MLSLKSVLLLAASATSVFAAIATPAALTTCEPVLLSWDATTAPYFLSIIPGNQPSAAALEQFPQQTATQFTWTVDQPAGTSVTIKLVDSTGAQFFSAAVTVQQGPSSSCVGGSSSSASTTPAVASNTSSSSRLATSVVPSSTTTTVRPNPVSSSSGVPAPSSHANSGSSSSSGTNTSSAPSGTSTPNNSGNAKNSASSVKLASGALAAVGAVALFAL